MELQQVIYHIFVTQIEFGTYRLGDRLPTIEEAGQLLFVSPDTVRSAYLRLKKEGYITLSKHIGAAVAVQFNEQEINNHILSYFVLRKNAMIDLSLSMKPLFAHIQCVCLKNAGPKLLDQIESITSQQDCLASYSMIQYMLHIYGSLENDLLMRLVWQVFMFFRHLFSAFRKILSILSGRTALCCTRSNYAGNKIGLRSGLPWKPFRTAWRLYYMISMKII